MVNLIDHVVSIDLFETVKIVKIHLCSEIQKIEGILQQIYPDNCIEIVRQFGTDSNVAGWDSCNNNSCLEGCFFDAGKLRGGSHVQAKTPEHGIAGGTVIRSICTACGGR